MIIAGGVSENVIASSPSRSNTQRANPVATSGVTGNLEYTKMLRNPSLTTRIVTPKGKVITSALSSDFGFNLGNSWNPLVPISSLPFVGDIGQGVAGVLTAIAGATQLSIESLWMTSASWSGSKMPTFPVSLAFLNYTSGANIISQMLGVAEGALPPNLSYDASQAGVAEGFVEGVNQLQETISSGAVNVMTTVGTWAENIGKSEGEQTTKEEWLTKHQLTQNLADTLQHSSQWAVAAPCNYGLQPDSNKDSSAFKPKPNTTFALEIGNWFKASQLLIDTMGVRFSKEIAPSGAPLVLYLDVTFRPYRNITYPELCNYFKLK